MTGTGAAVRTVGLGQPGGHLPALGQGELEARGRADLGVQQTRKNDAEDDQTAAEDQEADGVHVVPVRLEERSDGEDGAQKGENDAPGTAGHAGMVSAG
jgi:hypothetical protein